MNVPDAKEGQETSGAQRGEEPSQSLSAQEAARLLAAERDAAPAYDRHEPAAEAADIVADDTQEPGEDATAAEEEAPQWQPGTASASATAGNYPPLMRPFVPGDAAPSQVMPSSSDSEYDSDILESAGETADAIHDAAQAGQDSQADSAEDRSMKQETTQGKEKASRRPPSVTRKSRRDPV